MAKILVVDDTYKSRQWLSSIISRNHTVITAADGIEGIRKAIAEKPDLILLDTNMPRMNGYQVCQVIKLNPAVKGTPVIFLSDKPREIEKHLADKLGAFDCIPRPFDEKTIKEEVQRAIKVKESEVFKVSLESDSPQRDLEKIKREHNFSNALINFIKEYINSHLKLQMLVFFCENKRGHFSCWNISEKLSLDMTQARRVLDDFVKNKIIDRTPYDVNKYHYKPADYLLEDIEELYKEYKQSYKKQIALKKISSFQFQSFKV